MQLFPSSINVLEDFWDETVVASLCDCLVLCSLDFQLIAIKKFRTLQSKSIDVQGRNIPNFFKINPTQ